MNRRRITPWRIANWFVVLLPATLLLGGVIPTANHGRVCAGENITVAEQTMQPTGSTPSNASSAVSSNTSLSVPTGSAKPSVPSVNFAENTSSLQQPVSIQEALDRRGSITFRKTSLQEVVFLLSELWQINIVAGDKVTGDVSGVFNDAPLRDVLSAILTSSGYGYTAAGTSLVVLPMDEVGTNSPDFISKTLSLASADTTQRDSTLEAAKLLLSDRGRIQPYGTASVMVVDTPDRVARVEQMFAQLVGVQVLPRPTPNPINDNPSAANSASTPSTPPTASSGYPAASIPRIAYFTPQFTEASEMGESLQAALGDEVVVAVYAEENRIMVKGDPAQLTMAAEAFTELDVARAQVRITAMIYDVSIKELEEIGVNWGRDFRLNTTNESPLADFAGNVTEAVGFSTLGAGGASSLGIRTLTDNFDTVMLLKALDGTTESKLLADPSITVADRNEASIKIVQRIPVIAANPVAGSNVVFSQVEFEDAGVIMKVTPRISSDGTIQLKVQPEYSVVTDYINDNPVIDSRTAETTVRVQNGHMFVLGGLRQKTLSETVRGVPYLRDMKLIGKFFRNHETEVRESELIVFLRPELVSPNACGRPREQQAASVATQQIDAIPYATICPQAPYCHDKNCPNHHPRPRINGGSTELRMLGGEGITPLMIAYPSEMIEQVISDEVVGEEIHPAHPSVPYPDATMQYETYDQAPQPAPQATRIEQPHDAVILLNPEESGYPAVHVKPFRP